MIEFDCPKCLQQINARDQQAGQRIDCPSCATSLMVPALSAGNFDDLFDSGEDILNEATAKQNSATIARQLPDEIIDSKPPNKVQLTPIKQETAIPPNPPETATEPKAAPEPDTSPEPEASPEPIGDSSSDIFEDLQFPETPEQADPAAPSTGGEGSEIPTEDPFAVDPDKRLEVDGITDMTNAPDSFSLKCPVCESHLFVTSHAIGTQVKCADCFSPITVPKPTQKQIEEAAKRKSDALKAAELKLKDAEPPVDVDPSFGLAPIQKDLLAPIQNADDDEQDLDSDELKLEAPTELFGDLNDIPEPETKSARGTASDKAKIDPYRSRSSQLAKQKKRRKKKTPTPESPTGLDFPKFEFDKIFGEMVNLVTAPTVALRSIFAALLLAAGNVVGHFALSNYQQIQDPTMGDTGFMWFWRAGVGWTLFGLGTIFLWYTAGVIFRKTAIGQRTIDSWRIGPSTEWTSTFLLIGFSFAVAGSPLMMFGATWLSAPLRFFFALPMLVSVWFTQSPFKIISLDAFSRYRRQRPQWKTVWLVVLALASIAFTSGLMMAIPVPFLNIFTSLIGAVVLSFATLGYAAVAGWHSGKVVEELN